MALPLPPRPKSVTKSPVLAPAAPAQSPLNIAYANERADQRIGDGYVYVLHVRMANSQAVAGWVFLTHWKEFSAEELKSKLDQACQVVNQARLGARRKELAKVGLEMEPAAYNEMKFPSDVDMVEAVMCDKGGFKKLHVYIASGEIEPTIKIA